MIAFESPTSDRQVEHDVDELVHASAEVHTIEAPGVTPEEKAEIVAVTNALAHLRDAERGLSEAALAALGVTPQELRALQYLAVAKQHDRLVSPSILAQYLRVSAASMTKLLNKLERAGHVSRLLHPHDRRALQIDLTPTTQALVQRSVGRQQARRFTAAAQLTSDERALVARFLGGLADGIAADEAAWSSSAGLDSR